MFQGNEAKSNLAVQSSSEAVFSQNLDRPIALVDTLLAGRQSAHFVAPAGAEFFGKYGVKADVTITTRPDGFIEIDWKKRVDTGSKKYRTVPNRF